MWKKLETTSNNSISPRVWNFKKKSKTNYYFCFAKNHLSMVTEGSSFLLHERASTSEGQESLSPNVLLQLNTPGSFRYSLWGVGFWTPHHPGPFLWMDTYLVVNVLLKCGTHGKTALALRYSVCGCDTSIDKIWNTINFIFLFYFFLISVIIVGACWACGQLESLSFLYEMIWCQVSPPQTYTTHLIKMRMLHL